MSKKDSAIKLAFTAAKKNFDSAVENLTENSQDSSLSAPQRNKFADKAKKIIFGNGEGERGINQELRCHSHSEILCEAIPEKLIPQYEELPDEVKTLINAYITDFKTNFETLMSETSEKELKKLKTKFHKSNRPDTNKDQPAIVINWSGSSR